MSVTSRVKGVLALTSSLLSLVVVTVAQPVSVHASSGWLDRLNAWRLGSHLSVLTENTTWDQGDYNHSLYMVKDDQVTHYEVSTLPYYTVAGDQAAQNGNIQVSSTTSKTDESAIDWWMAAPFHAMGMMDPRLSSTGFGSYREVKSGWQAGFTLDTLRGNPFSGGSFPVFFPGNGSSVPLTQYSGNEFPDPLQACPGYSMPVGLPVFVEVGGNVATSVSAHAFTGNGAPLAHCVIDSSSPSVGSNLTYRGGVIVVPQQPLQAGVVYAVALTVNGLPYTWTFTVNPNNVIGGAIPTGWTSLGGFATSAPTISSWGATRYDMFVRGTDNAIWHRSWNGTAWSGWDSLGGIVTSDPSAVSQGPNSIDVFVRGTDNAIWHRSWNGTSWAWWDSVGGIATSAPAAASSGLGHLDFVVRGTNNALWHRSWNGTTWSGWDSVGGVATSDPSATSAGAGRFDIVVRGTDNGLWHRTWNGSSWGAWDSVGGIATSDAAITSCAAGHLDVFVTGTDGGFWQRGNTGSGWGTWTALHGYFASGPAAVCPPGTTTVQLLAKALDASVIQSTATGS
jgi:hypothetical protein